MRRIRSAAVLGAGVMGRQIAALLANANLRVTLLDVVPATGTAAEEGHGRSRLAREAVEALRRASPPALFVPERAEAIRVGNLTDHLGWLKEVDWILEAVAEDAGIKQALFTAVDGHRTAGSIVSSNTSSLRLHGLAAGRSEDFRRHFLGTHFFNPPRYMRLLEIAPTPETDAAVLEAMETFGTSGLGKGVVRAKDTPGFIANRIGVHATLAGFRVMEEEGLSVEEVDAVTGPPLGRPRTAALRTLDIVGLDTFAKVVQALGDQAEGDEERALFRVPPVIEALLKAGRLGEKSGAGFYKSGPDGTRLALDVKTLEYRPAERVPFPALEALRGVEDPGDRLRRLLGSGDRVAALAWRLLGPTLRYAAARVPEIADDPLALDLAMRWGFGWDLPPFAAWDALGVEEAARRLRAEGASIPPLVEAVLAAGPRTFYGEKDGARTVFDPAARGHRPAPEDPVVLSLARRKAAGALVERRGGASLVDLGDGVLGLEFHSKMNALGADAIAQLERGLHRAATDFAALVIGNQGPHFSAGADLSLLLFSAEEGDWDEVDGMVRAFQRGVRAVREAAVPVVAAPFGRTLGGGAEITLAAHRAVASAETYMGLVETGVGLIPAGGGCAEMLRRHMTLLPPDSGLDPQPLLKRVFETIAFAKVSSSAEEARRLLLLRPEDEVVMNPDRLLAEAKAAALHLARAGRPPLPPAGPIPVLGEPGFALLALGIHLAHRGGHITAYEREIATALARVLTGGERPHPGTATAEEIMDLEREAFLRLLGRRETQERIRHTLKTGKPLRN
ncbi:MAG TPA: 3-hydroxyacyl-CoA dehydrogenase/enoyl-CoA hydratase family protein [Candidatus Methylomirabilis sp.]|nr:3-hydroxyacyl-CoA dehydrogenase/enoyl-CoA hydratase family protein [Candidatus Methylomirabilis sp.]